MFTRQNDVRKLHGTYDLMHIKSVRFFDLV